MTDESVSGSGAKPIRRSPGRPRQEDVALIERHLLDVALREFLKFGYGGTSINRIVKLAGVSKTTMYSRFPSKKALFRAIIRQQIEGLSPATSPDLTGAAEDLESGLKRFANRMLEINLEGDVLGVNRLIYSESHRFPELGEAGAEKTEFGIERLSHFIAECAAADGRRCRNPRAAAEAFMFCLQGWYVHLMQTNRAVTGEEREHWVDSAVRVLLTSCDHW